MSSQDEPPNSTLVANGITYNATALKFWNYTLYSNGTLSNGSECYLVFDAYRPILTSATNGTFANTTSCYTPVNAIGARGITGLVFGSLFALSIVFSTINLRKHGRAYLPRERRWKPVGRRWPWYWTIFVAACALLSCFTAVDVDRDYIVNLPLILQSFFLTLAVPTVLACVWEAVRSWTSFKHRQIHDADPFAFRPTGTHARLEFYLPLVFYAFDWMVFFLVIPRGWTFVQKQRSIEQTSSSAIPAALDGRFKAGSILAVMCLGFTVFRLAYSSRVYNVRIPGVLLQVVLLVAIRLAYMFAGSWVWQISPYRLDVNIGWLYGLGYSPILLILCLLNLRGYMNENEEKVLIAQRASRGDEGGIPLESRSHDYARRGAGGASPSSWWSRSGGTIPHRGQSSKKSISPAVKDFSTGNIPNDLRVGEDESGGSWWRKRQQEEVDPRRRVSQAEGRPNRSRYDGGSSETSSRTQRRWLGESASSIGTVSQSRLDNSGRSHASSMHSLQSRPQAVRSMLDV
ncbi:hypothetical protein LTR84_004420 [Exophiala bonariae]|uniref:Uncharacterized protein n=1 Tax=Exophiala bonariae TaxID=1690606 RepID=A0AAV9N7H9_9EURO|nr:hypothetical protein LTR84_004420 [Exophiala bonariae]